MQMLVDRYHLQQQSEGVHFDVPDQAEIRYLNSFSYVICLRLLGSEFLLLIIIEA